jgi:hypothetical protein
MAGDRDADDRGVRVEVVTRYRLVRNAAIERWMLGRQEPFAPRYDVEEIDENHTRLPLRVIASGVDAELARAIIADAGGIEVPNA